MKQTIVDQIEITREGHLQIRMKKYIIDGNDRFELGYHRTIVEVDGDVDAQMAAVNDHLALMGFGEISSEEIDDIRAHAGVAWTPKRKEAFRQAKIIAIEKILRERKDELEKKDGSEGILELLVDHPI